MSLVWLGVLVVAFDRIVCEGWVAGLKGLSDLSDIIGLGLDLSATGFRFLGAGGSDNPSRQLRDIAASE